MAVPTFVAAGAAFQGSTGGSPAIPTGTAAGDIVLLFCESLSGEAITNPDAAVWSHAPSSPHVGSSRRQTVFWRVAISSTPAPSVADPGDHLVAFCCTIRGADTTQPFDGAGAVVQAPGTTSTWTCPTITTTGPDRLIVGASSTNRDQTSAVFHGNPTNANLTNLAEMQEQGTGGGVGGSIAAWKGEKATAGVVGSTTGTLANGSQIPLGITFAMRPPSRVTPDPVAIPLTVVAPVVTATRLVSPSPVTIPLSIPAPTVTAEAGGDTVSPDPVAVVLSVPAVSVTAGRRVSPSPVAVSLSVPAPTVSVGRVVSPDPVELELSVPAPSLIVGRTVSPAPVVVSLQLPALSVQSSRMVSPAPVAVSLSVVAPVVRAGRRVSPDPVSVSLVTPAVGVIVATRVNPAPVTVSLVTVAPSVSSGVRVYPDPVAIVLVLSSLPVALDPFATADAGMPSGGASATIDDESSGATLNATSSTAQLDEGVRARATWRS